VEQFDKFVKKFRIIHKYESKMVEKFKNGVMEAISVFERIRRRYKEHKQALPEELGKLMDISHERMKKFKFYVVKYEGEKKLLDRYLLKEEEKLDYELNSFSDEFNRVKNKFIRELKEEINDAKKFLELKEEILGFINKSLEVLPPVTRREWKKFIRRVLIGTVSFVAFATASTAIFSDKIRGKDMVPIIIISLLTTGPLMIFALFYYYSSCLEKVVDEEAKVLLEIEYDE